MNYIFSLLRAMHVARQNKIGGIPLPIRLGWHILLFCGLALPGYGQTTITVSSTDDSGPNTLREAITTANSNTTVSYLITLPASQTITLTSALPDITFSGTIAGSSTLCPATGVGGSTIARDPGAGEFRLLNLAGTNKVFEVADVSFLNGLLIATSDQTGGAIQVSISYSLTVKRCVFRKNEGRFVGAIFMAGSGDLIVEDSYFEENRCSLLIGSSAIRASNSGHIIRIDRTAFREVTAFVGTNQSVIILGGLSSILVRNCSFSGVTMNTGSSIVLTGVVSAPVSATIQHTTFGLPALNQLYANALSNNVSVSLQNNIFTAPTSTTAIEIRNGTGTGTFTSLGGNVFASDITSNLTLLASDKDNVGTAGLGLGSLTTVAGECIPIIPLGCFSQAIDAAVSSTLTSDALGTVQIGAARDAGAYESSNAASVTFTVASTSANCGSNSATLTASGCTGGTVNWPGGSTGAIYLATTSGTYTATCTVGSCSTTANVTATVTPTSFTVTSLADAGAGTLRQAFADITASSCPGQFTITFGVSGTVNLASTLTAPAKDILLLGYSTSSTDVVLQGGGASSNYRILTVPGSATLAVRYLSFTNARVGAGQNGGAISLDGGRLQLAHCYLYGNTAGNFGGALYHGGGSFTITNSTFASNTAISNSGALHKGTSSPGLIDNCTFSGNVGRAGGAIEAAVGSLTINNSTFTLNRAVGSSGAAEGGAIYGSGTTPVVINNCLIAGNSTLGTGPDLIAGFNSITGYNLIGTSIGYTLAGTTTGNIISVSARQYGLGSLGNYGGAAPTHALLPGSLAIDAGSPSGAPTTDQRGISRVGTADIGAFESQGFSLAISSGNNQSAFPNTAFVNPLRVSVSSANGEPVEGGIVSFSAPVSGPSATLSSTTVTISSGTVAVNATANATAGGPYSVTVGATGAIPATVAFSLTNTACPSALISVTSTADSGPGTLREAITNANANVDCGPYLITLPANQTIALTAALPDILFSGTIAGGSTLCPATGVGGSTIARTGSAEFRLLNLAGTNRTWVVTDLRFLSGLLTTINNNGGAIQVPFPGTGNDLLVSRCVFSGNRASAGGAIAVNTQQRSVRITDCYFDGNRSILGASALFINSTNTDLSVSVERTTFRTISTEPSVVRINSGNGALLQNCTFGGTGSVSKALIFSGPSSFTVQHSTFGSPTSQHIHGEYFNDNITILLQNNTFNLASGGSNVLSAEGEGTGSTTFTSLGGNVFANDIMANLTLLASDKDNIGTTGLAFGSLTALSGECIPTIPLLPGSAAINAGISNPLTTDARGISRVGNPDAGSFESRGFVLAVNSGNNQSAPVNTAFANPLQVLISSANGEPVEGGVVSFSARASGASAILSSTTATISSGLAAVNATANATQGGPYNVSATSAGSTPTVQFTLTNAAACVYSYTANLNDTGAGSLRTVLATIGTISGCTGQFTVTFANSGTVSLGSGLSAPANRDILIQGPSSTTTSVTLRGGGSSTNFSILSVPGSATLATRYLAFTNGHTTSSGGAISLSGGALQVASCYFYNNTATNTGGAIHQGSGSFTITNSTFASNTAISNSGAIHKGSTAPSLIENCTFSGNVGRAGGAIEASVGSLTINSSTFAQNRAVGNPSPTGAEGGAIYGGNAANVVTINNCLIVGNTSLGTGPDLVSGFDSDLGHNLIGNTASEATLGGTTTGNLTNIPASDYLLTGLGSYSGATPTHALLPGSVALNAGSISGAPATDGRGINRGSRPDIGAFESRGFTVGVNSGNNQSALFGMSFANPLRVIVFSSFSEPVEGGVVSFSAPSTFPSASLSGANVTITSGFTAQVTATADFGTGPYSVTAATRGGTSSALFSLTTACRGIVYVTQAGAGLQNGTSWTNAYSGTSLQEAIAVASGCAGGQVWVARGTYKPTTTTDRNVSFLMANNVAIYGGFTGVSSETALSNRPGVNPLTGQPSSSTLSGDIGTVGDQTDNSYHVINNSSSVGVTNLAILDGFVITQGQADEVVNAINSRGGGMFNRGNGVDCNPTIRNCVFVDNWAIYGGAVDNVGTSNPAFTNCVFLNNEAFASGGAIENFGIGSGNNTSPTLTNVLFSGNQAADGGAIYNNGSTSGISSPTLVNVSFIGNGGVIYNNATNNGISSPVLTNVSFYRNTGIVLYNSGGTNGSSRPTLTNCVVFGNIGSAFAFDNTTNAGVTATYSLFDAAISPSTYTATNSLTTTISPFASTTSTELSSCAPAINAGNNAASGLSGITTDIVGASRIVATTVDMGAYEFTGTLIGQTGFTTQPVTGSGVCPGATVTAGVSVSGTGPFSYQWYRDGAALTDITSATTASLTLSNVTSASAGNYSVVVTGSCNSATSTAFSLTVNPLPTAGLINNGPLTCAQTSVTLTASGGTSYTFANAGGIIGTPGASTTQTVSSAGTYSVTVANANGCISATTTSVSQNTALTGFALTASASVCAGTSVTLTASGCTGGTVNWPGGITGNTYSTSVSGIYTATCTVGTCATTASGTATIGASPTATLSASNAGTLTCAQTSLTLTATGGVSYTFTGPGLSQSGNSATAVVNQSGTYSVTVANASGCTSTTSVTVSQNTTTPTVSLGASNSLNCSLTSATLSATATGFSTLTYAFQNSSGLLPGSPSSNSTVEVNVGGSYSVLVTAANGCTALQTTSVVSDTALPTVSIAPTSATLTCAQPSLTLTATSSETGLRWSTGASSITLAVNSAGTYSVTATAPNGCTVASNTVVVVSNTALTGFTVASSASVCGSTGTPTGSVTLTASGCTSGTVNWPDGIIGNTFSTSITGVYTATCTVGLCSTTASGTAILASQVYTVTSLADAGAGTLRQALADIGASSCPGPFTVTFGLSGTINLVTGLTAPVKDVLILGPSSTTTAITLNGGGAASDFSILTIPVSATLTSRYLAFTNGHTSTNGGAILLDGGTMHLAYCYVYGNSADNFSGAIHQSSGSFTITNSTFSSNTAFSNGGAIVKFDIAPALIDNCTFSGNVGRAGGAIEGGIGSLTISNSTFTQNQAIGNPTGAVGGAIYGGNGSNRVTLNNCLIAGNTSLGNGPDLIANFDSNTGYNLVGNTSDATLHAITTGNITGVTVSTVLNPTLASNGAPTATHALIVGGPAYNAGPPASTDADQRGLAMFGGRRDIGAFESQTQPLTATIGSVSGLCAGTGGFSLTAVGGTGSGYQYRLTNADSFSTLLGSSPYTVTVSTAGHFTVTVQDSDGTLSNAVAVTILSEPTSPTLSGVLNCSANSVTLTANCTVGTALWSTSAMSRTIVVPATAMIYSASCVTSNCTSAGSSLTINPTANSFTVTSTADSGPNTLRQAILDMNSALACEPFLITIDAPGPVSLTAALPELLKSVTITSANALTPATATGGSTIERATGSADFRLLLAKTAGKSLTLRNLILQNGVGTPLAGFPYSGGGAVMTRSTVVLTMQRCLVRNCTTVSGSDGGGVQAFSGQLALSDCEFRNNAAIGSGGAVITGSYATINSSPALIERCTFVGNSAINGTFGVGGAVNLSGSSTVVTSTFDSNSASSSGKALYSYNPIVLRHSTFLNQAVSGASAVLATDNTITLQNNLFAQNTAPHFTGSYVSLGGNVSDKPDATTLNQATDRVGQLVSVSAAAANGGLVQTCELTGGCSNPAIDAGVATTLTADARGIAYVGAPDAGAYENGTGATSSVTVAYPASQTATVGVSFAGAFSATGGASPYTFTLVSGALPNGLTLSAAGSLSGTPTQAGTFTLIVRGTDANGCIALSNPYTLTVGLGCQPILHVTESGSGLQDGSSWANSFPGTALQTAIDQAASCGGGEVWVARGTYKPTTYTGPDSRTVSFAMRNNVQIYGGFAGLPSETTIGSRPVQNPRLSQFSSTTLSGDIGTVGDNSDNSYHVISNPTGLTTGMPTATALLDGVVITGGNANGASFYNSGGGLYNDSSSPTLQNCLFAHNTAANGGGMAVPNSGTPVLANCAFLYNTAANGGGMVVSSSSSQPILTGCRFEYNSATSSGGGISSSGTPTLTDCLFQYNTAGNAGGAIVSNTNAFSLTRCEFRYNTTNGSGGAIHFLSFHGVLTHCVFQSNTASQGGGIYNGGNGSPTLLNCAFQQNVATTNGGAMMNTSSSSPTLINCSFQSNSATTGGAIRSEAGSNATIANSVFFGNGGNNSFNSIGGSQFRFQYSLLEPASLTASGVDVSGPGNLTTSVSPFASTTDITLATCSPAINAGDPASITVASPPYSATNLPATDLAGNARIFNGGSGGSVRADMGAVEFQGEGLPTSYSVLGSGTATCASSPTITLNGSETGVNYQLLRGGSNVDGTVAGTGSAISFGPQSVSGTYTVLATGTTSGCTAVMAQSATVVSSTAVPSVTITPSSATLTCANPSLTLTAIGSGTAVWSTGVTASSIVVSSAGTYSVVLTNASGCTASANSVIESSTAVPSVTITPSSATLTCANPSLTLTAIGSGTAVWSTGVTASSIVVSSAGTYSVVLTNASGCTASASSVIESSTVVPSVTITPSSATLTCANPSLTLTAIGSGTAVWSTGVTASSIVVSSAGTYSVVLTNASGCTASASSVIESSTAVPSVTITPSSATLTCANPSLTLTAIGSGTAVWSTGVTASSIVVSSAGTYSVVLTNASGCTASASSVIESSTAVPSVTITPSSATLTCAAPSLTLTAIGSGTAVWSTGVTASSIVVSSAGTYSVVLTNASGCTASASSVIESSTAVPSVTITPSSATLTCAAPSLTLTAIGSGTALWSTGVTASSIVVSSAGTYSVVLTNASGCTASATALVSLNNALPLITSLTATGVLSCTNSSVSLQATASGLTYQFTGPGGYAYSEVFGTDINRTVTAPGVTQMGVYTLVVSQGGSCIASQQVTVTQDSQPLSVSASASGALGCGQTTVTVNAFASGASGYTLVAPTGATQSTVNGVFSVSLAGSYTVVAASSSGCRGMTTLAIASGGMQPSASRFVASGVLGVGNCRVQLLAEGIGDRFVMTGSNGYVYSGIFRTVGQRSVTGLDVRVPGTYTLTVYSGSCSATYTTVVSGTACPPGQ